MQLRRFAAITIAAGLSLLLAACLVSPGKFTAALDLRKDGSFSYSYKGEIYLLGLSKLAEMGAKDDDTFKPAACYKDTNFKERPCTQAELDQQKAKWDANAGKRQKDAEVMRAMLGGIDPTSPQAAEDFAARLRRQAGWRSVTYKGDGMFEVDFAISGRIDHDFTFPSIERFPMANAFVVLNRHADGSVRMDAPGFGPASNGGGMSNFAQLAAMGAMAGKNGGENSDMPQFPVLDGTLVLTSDGEILANNTDEGSASVPNGRKLEWRITQRTTAAPTALVRLGG